MKPGKRKVRRSFSARWLLRAGDGKEGILSNPVFRKELQSEFFARPKARRLLFWGPLVPWGIAALAVRGWESDLTELILSSSLVTILLLALLVPAFSSSTFSREIEQGNLDFLRGSRLSMRSILGGKLLAGLYATSGLVLSALVLVVGAFVAATLLTGGVQDAGELLGQAACSGLVVLVSWCTWTLFAVFVSILSRRTVQAMVLCYGSLLVVYAVLPAILTVTLPGYVDTSNTLAPATHPAATLDLIESSRYTSESLLSQGFVSFLGLHGLVSVFLWFACVKFLETRRDRDR